MRATGSHGISVEMVGVIANHDVSWVALHDICNLRVCFVSLLFVYALWFEKSLTVYWICNWQMCRTKATSVLPGHYGGARESNISAVYS